MSVGPAKFRPVELSKFVRKHDALADTYSWKTVLNDYLKQDNASKEVHLLKVLPSWLFEGSIYKEPMHSLSSDIALEIELRSPDVDTSFLEPNVNFAWFATVRKVCGYRVLLRWLGCDKEGDEKYDFWINFCSMDLHRVGWGAGNADQGVIYCCPEWMFSRQYDWNEYMAKMLTPMRTMQPTFEVLRRQTSKCKLQVGERIELLDNQVSTRVRPATVIKTVGRRVCVQVQKKDYDPSIDPEAEEIGEERQFDSEFWIDQNSFYIFHVGWAALNGYKCCAKEAYVKHAEKIAEALKNGREPDFAGSDVRPETIRRYSKNENANAVQFAAGQKLEFLDPLDTNFNKLKVGSVVKLMKDGYMIVAADGDDMENETVPFHCTSSFLFPVGYAQKYGIKLVPPGGDEDDSSFDWNVYMKQTRSTAAPECLFQPIPEPDYMKQYKVGSSLEASDLNESHLICPANIVSVKGRMVEVGYDGWGPEYNQLFDYRSNDIFPLGWAEAHGYKLEAPKVEEGPIKKKKK